MLDETQGNNRLCKNFKFLISPKLFLFMTFYVCGREKRERRGRLNGVVGVLIRQGCFQNIIKLSVRVNIKEIKQMFNVLVLAHKIVKIISKCGGQVTLKV